MAIRRLAPLGFGLLLMLVTALTYGPAIRAGYIWDDSDHVTQTSFQRTVTGLRWVWFKLGATPQYYPLTHTTFWLEWRVWGDCAGASHAVNVLLHGLNAVLLWRVLRSLRLPLAWAAALIFAVHPVHVESVAWITERKNVLSGVFYLLAALAAIRAWGLEQLLHAAETDRSRAWRLAYGLCVLCFICAVLSKTVSCTLPAALALVIWWKRGRVSLRDWLMLAPLLAIAIAVAKLTSGMEAWNVGATGPEFQFSLSERVLIAGRAVWFYAARLVYPHPLAFIYPRWNIDAHAAWQWAFPVSAAAVVLALFLLRRRIGRGPIVAVLFFIGTLFPALGFVNVYPMRFSFVADHFQYLASIGLIVMGVSVVGRLWACTGKAHHDGAASYPLSPVLGGEGRARGGTSNGAEFQVAYTLGPSPQPSPPSTIRLRSSQAREREQETVRRHALTAPDGRRTSSLIFAICIVSIVLATISFAQNHIYHDSITLWRDTLKKNPDCWMAMDNLAADLIGQGNDKAALDLLARSLAIHPAQREAHFIRGSFFEARGDCTAAKADFDAALPLRPDDPGRALHELAKLAAARGDGAQAAALFEKTLAIEPRLEQARLEYADLLWHRLNRPDAAAAQFQTAIELNPDCAPARSAWATLLYRAGDAAGALRLMAEAANINPLDAKLCNNYGVLLMGAGRVAEAAEQFNQAISDDPNFAQAYDGLGNAMQAAGRFAEAAGMYEKAIQLKPDFAEARQHLARLRGS